MARVDFEDILDKIKEIMLSDLNTKITAINSEKNDGITVPAIATAAYALQSLNDEIMNEDPFIVYGIEDIDPQSNGGQTLEKFTFSVVVVVADAGKENISRIMFRYSRALKEIFQDNWQTIGFGNRIEINRLTPVPFEALDSSARYKAVGVIIETSLA